MRGAAKVVLLCAIGLLFASELTSGPRRRWRRAWRRRARAQQVKRDAEKYYKEGLALVKKEKYDEAIAKFKLAIDIQGNYYDARMALGRELMRRGEFEEAEPHFRRAARIDKESPEPHVWLGDCYQEQSRLDEAMEEYNRALAIDGRNYDAKLGVGLVLIAKKELIRAEETLKEAVKLDSKPVAAHYWLEAICSHNGRLKDAIEHCKKVLRYDRDFHEAKMRLAELYERNGDFTKAISEYKRIGSTTKSPFKAEALLRVAQIYEGRLKDVKAAITYYEKYVKVTQDHEIAERVEKLKAGEPVPPVEPREFFDPLKDDERDEPERAGQPDKSEGPSEKPAPEPDR